MEQCPCNLCGRKLDELPFEGAPQMFRIEFGYGSKRDLTQCRFHLCPECLDKLYDELKSRCEIAPEEWELF